VTDKSKHSTGKAGSGETPLQGWKEIATYLDRDARTARRWKLHAALPVRRHGSERGSVYVYPSELDAWRAVRKPEAEEARSPRPVWKRPVPVLAASLALCAALAVVWMWRTLDPIARAGSPGEMAGIELRQVWAGKGADDRGAPSPDGRHLIFVDWDTGDLAVRDLGTGESRRLTHNVGEPELAGVKLRVLVAEDNVVNQKIVLKLLGKLGHSADAVANGLEAVQANQRVEYDVILMDCQMPDMDGYQATVEIRRLEGLEGRRIPIIALTANAMAGDREKCLDSGMDDFLTKPIRPKLQAETLNRWTAATTSELEIA